MIVDPDFLDHWRTQMLIDTLDDPCAPLYVIRLWAHCQTRRGWIFEIPMAGIKSICKFNGEAEQLNQALVDCEFLHRVDKQVTVVGWDEHNSTLIANWENGKKGGRPPKNKPINNPSITHGLSMANPDQTRVEPIRLDKIREDNNTGQSVAPSAASTAAKTKARRKQQAIELIKLWNEKKEKFSTNWQAVKTPESTSAVRYTAAQARIEWAHKYLKDQGKPCDWTAIRDWFDLLYECAANNDFYAGRPTERNPTGYVLEFKQAHTEQYFQTMLERLSGD